MLIEDPTSNASTPADSPARADRLAQRAPGRERSGYHRPKVDVLSLSCEISAYAPDEDGLPLF